MKKQQIFACLLILILASACKEKEVNDHKSDGNRVVSIKDETLYKKDIANIIPINSSPEDSVAIAKSYIDKWVKSQLLYEKAKQNVVDQGEIDNLVENYRRSLILNLYQERLFKEYFSQPQSEKEIKTYFEENKEQFKLKEDIIQGLFLKIPIESPQLDNFRKWYTLKTDDAIENIEKHTLQNAAGYEYFYDKWLKLSDILDKIPFTGMTNEQFLKSKKSLEVKDESFVYLLNIKDYRLAESEAPYEYAKGYLSEIFKEKKKEVMLKDLEQDLYNKAISGNEIKFYEK